MAFNADYLGTSKITVQQLRNTQAYFLPLIASQIGLSCMTLNEYPRYLGWIALCYAKNSHRSGPYPDHDKAYRVRLGCFYFQGGLVPASAARSCGYAGPGRLGFLRGLRRFSREFPFSLRAFSWTPPDASAFLAVEAAIFGTVARLCAKNDDNLQLAVVYMVYKNEGWCEPAST
jgi:hypothetical protein